MVSSAGCRIEGLKKERGRGREGGRERGSFEMLLSGVEIKIKSIIKEL